MLKNIILGAGQGPLAQSCHHLRGPSGKPFLCRLVAYDPGLHDPVRSREARLWEMAQLGVLPAESSRL